MNWARCSKSSCPYNSHAKHCYDGGSCIKPLEKKKEVNAHCNKMSMIKFRAMLKEAKDFWSRPPSDDTRI